MGKMEIRIYMLCKIKTTALQAVLGTLGNLADRSLPGDTFADVGGNLRCGKSVTCRWNSIVTVPGSLFSFSLIHLLVLNPL